MKTIFDNQVRNELILRINSLSKYHNAQWGKMNVFQMIKHNIDWNHWILGKDDHINKQVLMGRIFGKKALREMVRDEKPLGKNSPTSARFKIKEANGNVVAEKLQWTLLIQEYENYNNPDFIHDFFGKMTKEQVGILVFKHSDHHLRQFDV